ncbi:MAG TPA: sensor histidine kinase KdpD [Gemmatimonadaceae bacterium]|nr:sensor histidine kinase KdpD [Gemmatimonadaceae bacterium]
MSERGRPDPEALLAIIQSEAAAAERKRGRLKVFFGATAGVGKTYAMLQSAQERRRAGDDVVVGLVETHGRRETEALLSGLEILPRRRSEHRGVVLTELDLDAALARRPRILLVDELAHTNVPGSRHEKRWQDVEELLAAGIDVYTTLNVQHIESLNDVVTRITGVRVRETVPDSVLEMADEVELIDLPPEELLARLGEGKVYLPEQAERAMERFFRKGNLIALRQLALLRTADRVERQMEIYRRAHAAAETWPVRERLLVGVGPAPSSERLVRATKRMADRLGAEWTAIFVQTHAYEHWPQADRDRVWETLRLAEELGARTITGSGASAAAELLGYARTHNVTKIVVGKPTHSRWRDLLGLSFHDDIVRGSGGIDVYVITGEDEERAARPAARRARRPASRAGYGWGLLAVALATGVAAVMYRHFERTNVVMVYLLAVVLVAVRFGRRAAVLAAVVSVAAFDFFFVPPHLTFGVSDTQYLVTFGVMLVVALVIGTLTARLRQQGMTAREREWRTAFLYDLSRDLVQMADVDAMLRLALPRLGAAFDGAVTVLLPDAAGVLRRWEEGDAPVPDPSEYPALQWVASNHRMAGLGTGTFGDAPALYIPLAAAESALGVLWIRPADPDRLRAPEQLHLLETAVNQIAAAMERARLAEETRRIRELEEMDRLKSEFVAVASRELEGPLRSLTAGLGALREGGTGAASSVDARRVLAAAEDDVARLRALVDDLLDLARLEAGRLPLAVGPVHTAPLVEGTVARFRRDAEERGVELAVDLPESLPDVSADAERIAGVLASLIGNALHYTGAGGHVLVSADHVGRFVQFSVVDDGVGIPVEEQSRIFDRFVRLTRADAAGGTGLGLAIAREVVRAHRGAIWVDSGPGPGSVFSFTLPVAVTPTSAAPAAVPPSAAAVRERAPDAVPTDAPHG